MRYLIVKTSSLGDIIQAFSALSYLKQRYPDAEVDWVVEERFVSIVAAHPLVRRAIPFDKHWRQGRFWRSLRQSLQTLRACRYDAVFDLQGNCKSGVITALSRGAEKVGFGIKSVREWPNILATRTRFEALRTLNMRLQYVSLLQQYFKDDLPVRLEGVRFKISAEEQQKIQSYTGSDSKIGFKVNGCLQQPEPIFESRAVYLSGKMRIMVCPGSKWINKQLMLETLAALMAKIEQMLHCSFILVWGAEEEKAICDSLQRSFPSCSIVIDPLALPIWQNLMSEMDLVIAVDSSALHLCGTTSTPSFSIFGPTSPDVFKPVGAAHFAFQGNCPYGKTFEKQCPLLRSCSTGACIRQINADDLFDHFSKWWKNICK